MPQRLWEPARILITDCLWIASWWLRPNGSVMFFCLLKSITVSVIRYFINKGLREDGLKTRHYTWELFLNTEAEHFQKHKCVEKSHSYYSVQFQGSYINKKRSAFPWFHHFIWKIYRSDFVQILHTGGITWETWFILGENRVDRT